MTGRGVPSHLLCLGLALLLSPSVWASVDICGEPEMYPRLSAGYTSFSDTAFDQDAATISRENTDIDLLFTAGNDKFLFGAGHRYNIFDIEPLAVASNGHLHTSFLPFHWLSRDERRSFRVSVAAAMSASSNVFTHLGEFDTDALQFLAALVWDGQLSDRVGLRYGICGDHRFGEYRVYPTASILWDPHPDWRVEMGFPESKLEYRIADGLTSVLRIAPDGNEWYVLDRSRTTASMFDYESYVVELSLDWRFTNHFALTVGVGRQFDNHYEMTLLDLSRVRLSSDPVTRIGATIEWRF